METPTLYEQQAKEPISELRLSDSKGYALKQRKWKGERE